MVVIPGCHSGGRLSAEDNARVNVAMNQTRINHLAVRRLTELSGGQRQRAFLAMVPGPEYARCIT